MTEVSPGRAAATRWRKKPVEVEAVCWTGGNAGAVTEFTGREHFDILDEADRANCDDPDATATVFDKLHSTWVLVKDGQWIIRGVKGEFYPCDEEVFAATYEPADAVAADDPATRLLALPLPPNDSGASTVRGYLAALLTTLWREQEGFDGKRPFGNSGWDCDIITAMVTTGIVPGELDEEGCLLTVDDDAADALILAAIAKLGEVTQ